MLRDDCVKCGHAKETHYLEDEVRTRYVNYETVTELTGRKVRGACLGMHCNDCKNYEAPKW